MFNRKAFDDILKDKGITLKKIAEVIDISYQGLMLKLSGERQFNTYDICGIMDFLGLSDAQVVQIFFNQDAK